MAISTSVNFVRVIVPTPIVRIQGERDAAKFSLHRFLVLAKV